MTTVDLIPRRKPLHHTPPPINGMHTDTILAGIRERIETLKQMGAVAALKGQLASQMDGDPDEAICRVLDAAPAEAIPVVWRLHELFGELRRRLEFFALDELIDGELEVLKIEALARTPGGLAAAGYADDTAGSGPVLVVSRASAAGAGG